MHEELSNWSRHHQFRPARLHRPTSVEQIQEIAAKSRKLKVVGARHSFNDIADSAEDLLSLENMNQIVDLDEVNQTVTVEGGIRYDKLSQELYAKGYALHNLASLPDVTVAGACATATHGSGDRLEILATAVTALEFVTGNGEVIMLSREKHGEQFFGAVVSLGGLGVVTKLTLDVILTYELKQNLYENLSLAELTSNFEAIMSNAYSVSLFTDWGGEYFTQVWLKRLMTDDSTEPSGSTFFGATAAPTHRNPVPERSAEGCTKQMGIPGPWYDRLPHFTIGHIPSHAEELQTEYFVPRHHAVEALLVISEFRTEIAPLLIATEVRTIAADNHWMSVCYERDAVAIHFSWKTEWPHIEKLLPKIEQALRPFKARPHWGKLFTMPPEQVQSLYPKLPEFLNLLQQYDPEGKFRNRFLETTLSVTV